MEIRQCALLLERALRAENCSHQTRMRKELCKSYKVGSWDHEIQEMQLPRGAGRRTELRGITETDVEERWMASLLWEAPSGLEGYKPVSTFYAEADLIVANAALLDRTYTFKGTGTWWQVGLQVLTLSGWRPDCAQREWCNVDRAVPPHVRASAPIVVGAPDAMRWYPDAVKEMTDRLLEGDVNVMRVDVEASMHSGYGLSCAYIRWPEGRIHTQGWIVGEDTRAERSAYMGEVPLAHALRIVREMLTECRLTPAYIRVRAGSTLSCRYLLRRFNRGRLDLHSAAAAEIVEHCNVLATCLPCPLIINSRPVTTKNKPEQIGQEESRVADALDTTRARLIKRLLPKEGEEESRGLSRVPWTKEEVHESVDGRYELDEAEAVRWMGEEESSSCSISQELKLDRSIIREALKHLRHSRIAQVTLCSILCATRFKFFSNEGLRPTVCGMCGQTDSYRHLVRCTEMGQAPTDPEALATYLAAMAERACVANPNLPVPVPVDGDQEIDLEMFPESETGSVCVAAPSGGAPEFDNDDEVACGRKVVPLIRD